MSMEDWLAARNRNVLKNDKLTIIGRMGNLFFSDGEGIQPGEVECVIVAHPHVLQTFIIPIEGKEFDHHLVAVIEHDANAGETDLEEWVENKLAHLQ